MRTTSVMAVLGLSLWLGAGAGCSKGGESADAEKAAVAEVTLTRVERGDISDMLTLSGSVTGAPNNDVRVSSLVAGRIAEMRAAEGDAVQAGQVLAHIDARPYREQLVQAEASVAQAQANLENATAARKRNDDLVQRGIAARKDLEDARTQESVSQAALKQAEAAVSLAKMQVARTTVESPLTGVVVKRFVGVGEQVDGTAGQPVVEVANLREVELVVNVPAAYLAKLHRGQSLALAADAFPERKFAGRILAIPAAVDAGSNAGAVRIRLANPRGELRLGMFLKAELPLETHAKTLLIPVQALYRDEQSHPVVYKVEGENATATDVKVGVTTPEKVEILDGVKAGDTIVLTGGYGLGEKAKVKVKSGEAK
jgi:membrane fusion protein (multidrug efflux system)